MKLEERPIYEEKSSVEMRLVCAARDEVDPVSCLSQEGPRLCY